MKLNEAFAAIKETLKSHFGEAVVEKFDTKKLNDGITTIEWDGDLATGTVLYVIDTNGARVPAPVGVHTLEDGTQIEVADETGLIGEVVLPKEESPAEGGEPVAEPEMAATPITPQSPAKRVIKSIIEEQQFKIEIEGVEPISVDLSELFNAIEKVKTDNESLRAELVKSEKVNKEIFSIVEKIADEPISAPTESKPKTLTRKEIKEYFNQFKK